MCPLTSRRDVYKRQPQTAARVDEKVLSTIKECHEKAARILLDNREKLDELAAYLLERETITGEEFMGILEK